MIGVIGDIMIDEYIYGSSTRQSPESAQAPVIIATDNKKVLGGAGNTALNILYLGANVELFAACEIGGKTRNLLSMYDLDYTLSTNSSIDIVKTRIYSNGCYIARVDKEKYVVHDEQYLVDALFSKNPELIIISDYDKRTVSNPEQILERARKNNIRVLVDTKSDLSKYKGAFLVKPNLKEFLEWVGLDIPEDQDEAINMLTYQLLTSARDMLKVDNLVITLGAKGCIHVDSYGVKKYATLPNKAIDVTGAGDSFIAGLAVALVEGKGIKRAIDFANKVASIAVTKKGTHYVKRNEI